MSNINQPKTTVKLSNSIAPDADEGKIRFLEALGLRYAYTWKRSCLTAAYEELARLHDGLARHGITLYNAGDYKLAKSANIILGTPERDRDIEGMAEVLRTLARLGVYNTTFTWEADLVWSSGSTTTRGGCKTRYCDENDLLSREMTRGRVYTKDELWETFDYYMKRIIPVCEETGVRLALHPNDPPMPMIAGVACLITSAEDYRRAFAIADGYRTKTTGRPPLGMEFCCGCWLEGGGFRNITDAIREFVHDGRVIITHLRNIDAPLPRFTETFLNDGYGDMLNLVETFCEAGYDGTMIYDHSPVLREGEGGYAETAYSVGYIQALLLAAQRNLERKKNV
ncbi:MAG: mannonate dehydratase [Eubacteriales bacterium]|jgi:mannonate dehydratase